MNIVPISDAAWGLGSKPVNVYLVLYFNFTHQIRLLYSLAWSMYRPMCDFYLSWGNARKMSLLIKARLTVFTSIDFSEWIQSNYRFWMKRVQIAFNAQTAQVFNIIRDHVCLQWFVI